MKRIICHICIALTFSFALLTTCLSVYSFAKETVETMPEIVVTATRYKEAIDSLPVNVTYIDEEDIENSTAQFIPDLLKTQVGIKVSDITGNRRNYNIDVRGFGETGLLNTLILVDGRKVNQVDLSGTDWTQIPLDRVAKIEIVRGGSGSVLYGDNAAGGVINIITKKGEELKSGGEISTGSFGTVKGGAYIADRMDNIYLALSGSSLNSGGYRKNSYMNAKDGGVNLDYHLNDSIAFTLNGGYHEDKAGLPGALKESNFASGVSRTASLTPDDFSEVKDYYIQMVPVLDFLDDSFLKIDASFRKRTSLSYASSTWGNFTGDTAIETIAVLPQIFLNGEFANISNKLTLGFDYYSAGENIANNSSFSGLSKYKLSKGNYGYYLHDELELSKNLRISGGYRNDTADYTFEPSTPEKKTWNEAAYTAGINYSLHEKYSLYLSFAKSFRYPVLDELYSFFANTIDTNLHTQTSDNFETGVKFHFDDELYGVINLFRIDTRNEIFYNPLNSNTNMDGTTGRDGIEISLSNEFDWVTLKGGYTYLAADIKDGQFAGKNIPDVPKHKATLDTSFMLMRGLTIAINGTYVGERPFISDFSNSFKYQEEYIVLNTKLKYRWKTAAAFLDINNLTNREYSEYGTIGGFPAERAYYPSNEINFLIGLSANF